MQDFRSSGWAPNCFSWGLHSKHGSRMLPCMQKSFRYAWRFDIYIWDISRGWWVRTTQKKPDYPVLHLENGKEANRPKRLYPQLEAVFQPWLIRAACKEIEYKPQQRRVSLSKPLNTWQHAARRFGVMLNVNNGTTPQEANCFSWSGGRIYTVPDGH